MNDKKSTAQSIKDNSNKDSVIKNEDSDKTSPELTSQKNDKYSLFNKLKNSPRIKLIMKFLIIYFLYYIIFFTDIHFLIKILCGLIAFIFSFHLHSVLKGSDKKEKEKNIERKKEIESRLVCPFCLTKGSVTTEFINQEIEISGIDGLTAIYTNDMSIFESKLAEAEEETSIKAYCNKCESIWYY